MSDQQAAAPVEDPVEAFKAALARSLERNEAAFKGKYRDELDTLLGLSDDQIKEVCPTPTSSQDYAQLISVVREASRMNVSQAELGNQIKALGDNAVRIAKLVAGLAKLVA